MKKQYSNYNAGLYVRLSLEDTANTAKQGKGNPFKSESASIENQRAILMEYANLRGWNVVRVYADDGYAGGSFNRPAFQEMVSDAQAGLIDLILVKDLSRLGRDYIEIGRYTDEVFPSLGCRFIALMDDIDSEGNSDFLPFRSLLNDYYLKDLSRKVKSTLYAKARVGDCVGGCAPYGYKKEAAGHRRFIIDPYAAEVVRRIFDLRAQPMGYAKIAATLNADGILAPRAYYFESKGRPNPFDTLTVWQDRTIKSLLKNEVYLGHSVRLKKRTVSYKNKKLVDRTQDGWIRVENTHLAIIDKEMWYKAQAVNLIRCGSEAVKKATDAPCASIKRPQPSLFSGLLVCADCGTPMVCNTETHRRNGKVFQYRSYQCGKRKRTGGQCSWHTIYEKTLLRIVREDIQRQLAMVSVDEGRVIKEIQSRLNETSIAEAKKELKRLAAELAEADTRSMKLYEGRLSGALGLDAFKSLSAKAEEERIQKQAEYDRLSKMICAFETQTLNIRQWISDMHKFMSLESPDHKTLAALIEKIEVGECEDRGKDRWQGVGVVYYVGNIVEIG